MQLERVKEVGKKKIIVIGTALMLSVGGVSAFASGTVQDTVKTAIDGMFNNAVNYYIQNIDKDLHDFAEAQKGDIAGTVANTAVSYLDQLKSHYETEIARAKKEISNHKDEAVQAQLSYANGKYYESRQKITSKVNEDIAKEEASIDDYVKAEFEQYNKFKPEGQQ